MAEPRTLSVAWLPRGKLKSEPDRVNLEEDELIHLKRELGDMNEEDSANELSDGEADEISEEKKALRPEMEEADSAVWDRFNLDDYDDEPGIIDPGNIGALVHEGNDEYAPEGEFEKEDKEDLIIKPEDHVLLAGIDSADGIAAIEVRIFNSNEEYYVRNDISLSGPPLCLCYINSEIGQAVEDDVDAEYGTNFVAVGTITSEIQIWDLDVIDAPGPAYVLTGHQEGAAIVGLSWDEKNQLASGGTDGYALVWSLETASKVALGEKADSPLNQIIFSGNSRVVTGDGSGLLKIFDKRDKWVCVKKMKLSAEIEKIAVSESLIAVGTSEGNICLLSQSGLTMTAHWAAHLPTQPITGLQFRSEDHLFSSGHFPGASLTVWNVSKHLTDDNTSVQPLAQHSRRRQKQGGKIFSTVLCSEEKSSMVLVGGERGGPQVFKISQSSKKAEDIETDDDDSDTEDENDEGDDAAAVDEIKEEEWETDSGSSEGEEIEE